VWYLLVEETMALRHVIVTKRDSRGVGREISWAHDEKIWKDVKIQEKKNRHTMDICGHVDFGYDIRCKRMREKKKINKLA
jgi:hypothetical protein